ncbi:hypothetical protein [Haloplasma contractile]|uniref:DUF1871 domain-containing protein n=1 Tax=Haloplasma contractile SSD-17B TaxID=1033810 RepID=F7PZK9_9MOLU|nr:hypothetical protein [Haloplasma contractile]ERJ13305.1 hypothetical protein HLPCO_000934 [Haloplasma contractile SSD-17B]
MNEIKTMKALINLWDPIQLLYTGCPEDEYDTYIDFIVKKISSNNPDEIAEIIYSVFSKHWGTMFKHCKKKCYYLAQIYLCIQEDGCKVYTILEKMIKLWDPIGFSNLNYSVINYTEVINSFLVNMQNNVLTSEITYSIFKEIYGDDFKFSIAECEGFIEVLYLKRRFI